MSCEVPCLINSVIFRPIAVDVSSCRLYLYSSEERGHSKVVEYPMIRKIDDIPISTPPNEESLYPIAAILTIPSNRPIPRRNASFVFQPVKIPPQIQTTS